MSDSEREKNIIMAPPPILSPPHLPIPGEQQQRTDDDDDNYLSSTSAAVPTGGWRRERAGTPTASKNFAGAGGRPSLSLSLEIKSTPPKQKMWSR